MVRFRREARAASGVSHRGVAHVYDFGEAEDRHYLAMEYVEGLSLREVLRHESLSVGEAVALASQVAAALSAAHERGVVHRDIKPENIVVTGEGHAKVLDFGLAKLLKAGERVGARAAPAPAHATLDSAPGLIMGTVAYMSPEQLRGEEVDARTDLWSLGVVFYEMVARRRPFEGKTPADQIAAILHAGPPAVNADGRATEELNHVLGKALAKERAARYRTAGEFAREDDYVAVRRAIDVDFLLAGRVTPGGDGTLTVNVYLVDLARGERVWEDSYVSPSGELLYVRNALFVLLSNRLQTMLAGDKQLPLLPASTLNVEAYRAYLRGAYSHDRRSTEGLKRAVESLERAVEECQAALALDPRDWSNYSCLAMAQLKLGRAAHRSALGLPVWPRRAAPDSAFLAVEKSNRTPQPKDIIPYSPSESGRTRHSCVRVESSPARHDRVVFGNV